MSKLFFSQSKYLAFVLFITLVSINAYADIYKWRNARGVMQYSDKPPMVSFTKATRNELLNSIQSKDVCTVGPVKKNIALATSQAKNFSSFFDAVKKTSSTISQLGISSTSTSSTTYFGNTSASLSGSSTKRPVKNTRTTSTTTTPIATTTTPITITTAPTTPTTTTTTSTQPLTVATTTPTTTSTTNIVQTAMMPAVDISKNVTPAVGYSALRIQPTTEVAPIQGGAVRVSCAVSHMSNDDPMVYPNQPGAAHHHTFFGNTTTNAKSDLMAMSTTGNSTCDGGIMNRSAYWVPSMIDTNTNAPIKPDFILFYYKTGDFGAMPTATITPPPKGLRMIAGNSKATTAADAMGLYSCISPTGETTPWQPNIINCAVGDTMMLHIDFPQCWDGVNLDSPDHKSHMSNRVNSPGIPAACPVSHPVMIPAITLTLQYRMTVANQTANWRLASDNYSNTLPGGYSTHADWVNGWDSTFMAGIVKNCLQRNADGHTHLLCDGRAFY